MVENLKNEKAKTMPLFKQNLEKVTSGRKTIDVRVGYPSVRNLESGQLLRFVAAGNECLTRIVRVTEYPSFEGMLDAEDPRAIGFDEQQSRDEVLSKMRGLYPPEKEALGVLAIEVEHAN